MVTRDIAVIGSGLSGLTAAYNLTDTSMEVSVFGKVQQSHYYKQPAALNKGDLDILKKMGIGTSELEDSKDLLKRMRKWLDKKKQFRVPADVSNIFVKDNLFHIKTVKEKFKHRSVIFALGRRPEYFSKVMSEIENIELYLEGLGVSFNAECDAQFYKGKSVVMLGSGNSAISGLEKLKPITEEIHFIPYDRDEYTLKEINKMGIRLHDTGIDSLSGKRILEKVHLKNGDSIEASALFIEVGPKWINELAVNIGIFPENWGYLKADEKQSTYLDGVFACGDVVGPPFELEKAMDSGYRASKYSAAFVGK